MRALGWLSLVVTLGVVPGCLLLSDHARAWPCRSDDDCESAEKCTSAPAYDGRVCQPKDKCELAGIPCLEWQKCDAGGACVSR